MLGFQKRSKGNKREERKGGGKKSSLLLPLPSFHISLFQRTTKAKPKNAEVLVFFCSCYFLLLFKLTVVIMNGPTLPCVDLPLGFLPSRPRLSSPKSGSGIGCLGWGAFTQTWTPLWVTRQDASWSQRSGLWPILTSNSALPHLTSDQMDKVLPPAPSA